MQHRVPKTSPETLETRLEAPQARRSLAEYDKRARAALERTAVALGRAASREEVLAEITRQARQALGALRCSIVLVDEGGRATIHAEDAEGERLTGMGDRPGPITSLVMEKGEPVIISDTSVSPLARPQIFAAGIKSSVALPIQGEKGPLGALYVHSGRTNAFGSREVRLLAAFASYATIALEQARLRELEKRSHQRREILARASLTITSQLALKAVLQQIADVAREFMRAQYAAVSVVDDDGVVELFVTSGITPEQRNAIGLLPRGLGLLGAITSEVIPLRVRDIGHDPRSIGFPPNHPPMSSFLGCPILSGPRVLGAIYATNKLAAPEFTEEDAHLLSTLATHVAVAIRNAQSYAAEQKRQRELETLQRVTALLASELDVDRLMKLVAKSSRELLGADGCAVFLEEPGTRRPECPFFDGVPANLVDTVLAMYPRTRTAGVIRQGRPIAIQGIQNLKGRGALRRLAKAEGLSSVMNLPLLSQGGAMGALALFFRTARTVGAERMDLARSFANAAATALHNAQLHSEMQQKTRQLDLARRVSGAIASSIDLDTTLRQIADNLATTIDCTFCGIALASEDLSEWRGVAASHPYDQLWRQQRRSKQEGRAMFLAMDEGTPVVIEDFATDRRAKPVLAQVWGTKSGIFLPMVARGKTMGVIMLAESRRVRRFTPEEVELAQAMASQAAAAIANAADHDTATRRLSQLELLNQVITSSLAAPDVDRLLELALKASDEHLGYDELTARLIDPTTQELVLRACTGRLMPREQRAGIFVGEGLAGAVAASGEPVLIEDARQDPRLAKPERAYRSYLCVPMKTPGGVIGTLTAINPRESAYSSEDLMLLTTLAGHLAALIENVRLAQEARETANLRRLNEIKTMLIDTVSHELRTPLSLIQGYSELLSSNDYAPEQYREMAGAIHSGALRLGRVVGDILDFQTLQKGLATLNVVPTSLEGLVRDLYPEWAAIGPEHTLLVEIDPSCQVLADPARLAQVLTNLVTNAIKFSDPGTTVAVLAKDLPDAVEITVEDHGVGISAEDLPRIFDPFHRARSSYEGAVPGQGLGLAIVKQLVDQMGGSISVSSRLGHGSLFTVRLKRPQRAAGASLPGDRHDACPTVSASNAMTNPPEATRPARPTLLLATWSEGKVRELMALLSDLPLRLTTLGELGLTTRVDETGDSFCANARLKALEYHEVTGLATLAEDSGLEVQALGGQPGVYSARYGNLPDGPGKNALILSQMAAVAWQGRQCRYFCCMALVDWKGQTHLRRGSVRGMVALEPAGEGGFGFDPIFFLPRYSMTMGQLSPELKNRISHRGRAGRRVRRLLRAMLDSGF